MTKLKKAMGSSSGKTAGEGGGGFSSLTFGSESDHSRRSGNRRVGGLAVPNPDLVGGLAVPNPDLAAEASPQSLGSLMVQLGGLGDHLHPGAVPSAGGGRRQALASSVSEHEEDDESDDEEMLAISEPVYYAGYIWVGK